jgi:hypothetical protein
MAFSLGDGGTRMIAAEAERRIGAASGDCYAFLEEQSIRVTRCSTGFTGLTTPAPQNLSSFEWNTLAARHKLIKEWQTTTLELFTASLAGEVTPAIAELFLREIPPFLVAYHRDVMGSVPVKPPVFFRTDEAVLGKVVEVQSPGSQWGTYEQLQDYYKTQGFPLGTDLSEKWAKALSEEIDKPPIVYHIVTPINFGSENYFIQKARRFVPYCGYDRGIRPLDCNFVRAHSYLVLVYEAYAQRRREAWATGDLRYDSPPISIFQQKVQLCLPFWPTTRQFYRDAVRELFPFTCLVTPEGVLLEDDQLISIPRFCDLPRRDRQFYLKYGGADLNRNWGAIAVYNLAKLSRRACLELLQRVVAAPECWVLQRACTETCEIEYITRDLNVATRRVHPKYSCFFGPSGLLAVLAMYETFYKVHGSTETITTVASAC